MKSPHFWFLSGAFLFLCSEIPSDAQSTGGDCALQSQSDVGRTETADCNWDENSATSHSPYVWRLDLHFVCLKSVCQLLLLQGFRAQPNSMGRQWSINQSIFVYLMARYHNWHRHSESELTLNTSSVDSRINIVVIILFWFENIKCFQDEHARYVTGKTMQCVVKNHVLLKIMCCFSPLRTTSFNTLVWNSGFQDIKN